MVNPEFSFTSISEWLEYGIDEDENLRNVIYGSSCQFIGESMNWMIEFQIDEDSEALKIEISENDIFQALKATSPALKTPTSDLCKIVDKWICKNAIQKLLTWRNV